MNCKNGHEHWTDCGMECCLSEQQVTNNHRAGKLTKVLQEHFNQPGYRGMEGITVYINRPGKQFCYGPLRLEVRRLVNEGSMQISKHITDINFHEDCNAEYWLALEQRCKDNL